MILSAFVTCELALNHDMRLDCVVVGVHFAIQCVCLIFKASGHSRTEFKKDFNKRCVEPQYVAKLVRATIVRPRQQAAASTAFLPPSLFPHLLARRPPETSVEWSPGAAPRPPP